MKWFLAISHALTHPKRVRMLAILQGRELCSCQIARALRLSKEDALGNLRILTRAGLITSGQAGQWSLYRPVAKPPRAIRMAVFWTLDTISDDPCVLEDLHRLNDILRRFPLERCRQVNGKRPYRLSAPSAEATEMGEAMPPITKRTGIPKRPAEKAKAMHAGFDDSPNIPKTAKTEVNAPGHYRRRRDRIRSFIETLPQGLRSMEENYD